jgi:hypothetical protein
MKKLLIIAVLFFSVNCYAEQVNSVIAKVNDEIITSKDLADYSNMVRYQYEHNKGMASIDPREKDFQKRALNKLIEERLILFAAKAEQKKRDEIAKKNEKEASKIKLAAPEAMIDKQLKEAASEFPDRESFEKSLATNGLNNTLLRERFENQWLMQVIVEIEVSAYVNVAPREAAEFFKKHQKSFVVPARYDLYIGRFMDQKDWDGFKNILLAKGIDTAQSEYSHIVKRIDAVSSSLRPEFAKPLEQLKEKSHFTVAIDEDKYFIYLIKRIDPKLMSYKQSERYITNFLWTKKFRRRFNDWLSNLRMRSITRTFL